ncbi:protein neprosin-like [Silene latifolia]|uniref:protein neprosin-like n=1 Tax=Silene latifolia TaxID=37657 RepID=UPI003D78301F
MAQRQCILYYIIVVLDILVLFGVIGDSRLFTKDEELPPHKDAIKTIKTEYGDMYDCVDFYKQPSLDHPLLKNHNFHPEMRPTTVPKAQRGKEVSQKERELILDGMRLKDGGCPKGSVPIRRMPKHGAVRPPITSLHHLHHTNSSNYIRPGTFFAIAQTKNDIMKGHYGVGASISSYHPQLLSPVQYSSAEVIIKAARDSITVGTTVNPSVYKDNLTRFFVYTVVNGKPCFDGECGFISVRTDIPPSFPIKDLTTRGGPIFSQNMLVSHDPRNKNWWLEVNGEVIGFWSSQLFYGLANSGTYIACGGEVYYPGQKNAPEMGCGFKPQRRRRLKYVSYCNQFVR